MGIIREMAGLIFCLVIASGTLISQHSTEVFSEYVDNEWLEETRKEFKYDGLGRMTYQADYKNNLSGRSETQWKLKIESFYEYDSNDKQSRLVCFSYNDPWGHSPQGSKSIYTCDYKEGPDGQYDDYDCEEIEFLYSGEVVYYHRQRKLTEYENGCPLFTKVEFTVTKDASPEEWETTRQWDYALTGNCIVSFYSSNSRIDGHSTIAYEYDGSDNITRQEVIYYSWRSKIVTLNQYDDKNRLIEQLKIYYDNFTDNIGSNTEIFHYDASGNISKVLFTAIRGEDIVNKRTSYEYHIDNGKLAKVFEEEQDSLDRWHLKTEKSYEYTIDGKPLRRFEQYFHLTGRPLLSDSEYYGFLDKTWDYDFYGYLISDKSMTERYEGDSLVSSSYRLTDYLNRCDGQNIESVHQSESLVGGPYKAPYRKYRYVRSYPSEPRCDDDSINNTLLSYPNPAENYCIVQSDAFRHHQGDADLRVINSDGRVLLSQKLEVSYRTRLDISSLPAGTYFIELTHSGKGMVGSLIKI